MLENPLSRFPILNAINIFEEEPLLFQRVMRLWITELGHRIRNVQFLHVATDAILGALLQNNPIPELLDQDLLLSGFIGLGVTVVGIVGVQFQTLVVRNRWGFSLWDWDQRSLLPGCLCRFACRAWVQVPRTLLLDQTVQVVVSDLVFVLPLAWRVWVVWQTEVCFLPQSLYIILTCCVVFSTVSCFNTFFAFRWIASISTIWIWFLVSRTKTLFFSTEKF